MANPVSKSTLDEIFSLQPVIDPLIQMESKGINVISSAINLLEWIEQKYGSETSDLMQKRMLLSIKARSASRYKRGVSLLREHKKDDLL